MFRKALLCRTQVILTWLCHNSGRNQDQTLMDTGIKHTKGEYQSQKLYCK